MANAINDGLNKPGFVGSPITAYLSGNSTQNNLNGQVVDFGTVMGSGNTSVVVFAKTFTAVPVVTCLPSVGSVGVASLSVLSAIGTGSFSVATGSSISNTWIAIGSGNY